MTVNVTIEEKEKLRKIVKEISNSLERIAGERELINEILKESDGLGGIDKKMIRRAGKTLFKADYSSQKSENEIFEELYDNVIML